MKTSNQEHRSRRFSLPAKTGLCSLMVLMVLVFLAGCGGSSSTSVPTTSPTPTPTPTPVAEVSVSLSTSSVTVVAGGTATFAATVTNATDQSVTWSVQEGTEGGTITPAGVYTAQATAGTYHVVATSDADPSKSASALVTVTGESGEGTLTIQ